MRRPIEGGTRRESMALAEARAPEAAIPTPPLSLSLTLNQLRSKTAIKVGRLKKLP